MISIEIFEQYEKCVKRIDDYFEYSHESEKDKAAVMGFIDQLSKNLAGMAKGEKND